MFLCLPSQHKQEGMVRRCCRWGHINKFSSCLCHPLKAPTGVKMSKVTTNKPKKKEDNSLGWSKSGRWNTSWSSCSCCLVLRLVFVLHTNSKNKQASRSHNLCEWLLAFIHFFFIPFPPTQTSLRHTSASCNYPAVWWSGVKRSAAEDAVCGVSLCQGVCRY